MVSAKKKFILNLLIFAVLIFAFLYFCLNYLIKNVEISSAQIVENKKDIYVLNSKNQQLSDLRKKYNAMEEQMDKAFEVIADKGDTVDFIEWSEEAARKNKVKLKKQVLDGKEENDSKKESNFISFSNFSFSAGGKFQDVASFLYSMENCKYEVEISNVKIKVGDFDEDNKSLAILSFDLKLYQKSSQK